MINFVELLLFRIYWLLSWFQVIYNANYHVKHDIGSNDTNVEGNNLVWTEVNKTELDYLIYTATCTDSESVTHLQMRKDSISKLRKIRFISSHFDLKPFLQRKGLYEKSFPGEEWTGQEYEMSTTDALGFHAWQFTHFIAPAHKYMSAPLF